MMTIAGQPTIALLISEQGPLRDSLLALLRVLPEIDYIAHIEDLEMTSAFDAKTAPTLVLIDGDLVSPDRYAAVQQMRARWSRTGFVFFANDVRQQRAAQNAGIGLALLKGYPASQLVTLISSLVVPHTGIPRRAIGVQAQ
jgi:DNA-binding NarL/FixJ family response regulator